MRLLASPLSRVRGHSEAPWPIALWTCPRIRPSSIGHKLSISGNCGRRQKLGARRRELLQLWGRAAGKQGGVRRARDAVLLNGEGRLCWCRHLLIWLLQVIGKPKHQDRLVRCLWAARRLGG